MNSKKMKQMKRSPEHSWKPSVGKFLPYTGSRSTWFHGTVTIAPGDIEKLGFLVPDPSGGKSVGKYVAEILAKAYASGTGGECRPRTHTLNSKDGKLIVLFSAELYQDFLRVASTAELTHYALISNTVARSINRAYASLEIVPSAVVAAIEVILAPVDVSIEEPPEQVTEPVEEHPAPIAAPIEELPAPVDVLIDETPAPVVLPAEINQTPVPVAKKTFGQFLPRAAQRILKVDSPVTTITAPKVIESPAVIAPKVIESLESSTDTGMEAAQELIAMIMRQTLIEPIKEIAAVDEDPFRDADDADIDRLFDALDVKTEQKTTLRGEVSKAFNRNL